MFTAYGIITLYEWTVRWCGCGHTTEPTATMYLTDYFNNYNFSKLN